MSRHNRRRSRGGRKHAPRTANAAILDDGLGSMAPSLYNSENTFSRYSTPSPIPDFVDRIPQLPPSKPLPRGAPPSARVWHNRYMAWQARKQLELEQQRDFDGGRMHAAGSRAEFCNSMGKISPASSDSDLSDDEADQELDAKMMDYFHGLDWLV